MKVNCWEFKKCGREAGGANAKQLGVCPASVNDPLHGVHGGVKGGRACWVISGTLCEGTLQGTFARKFSSCKECEFYQLVKKEESPNFMLSATLLAKVGKAAS
ncbi:MAG: hypothetical protein M0018_08570 [Nitrospiraceae bacterium]|nr:hypothetical protein [Nitrospiraceae bacterium]